MAEDLQEALQVHEQGLLVAIPDVFNGLDQYIPATQDFWKDFLLVRRSVFYRNCDPHIVYGNAFTSRCYLIHKDRSRSKEWFELIRNLWANERITVIEGTGSHTGVGNDLLSKASEIQRVLCPAQQAYDYYEEIKAYSDQIEKDRTILIALGPTSKILGAHMHRNGYRVLDIGNLDMEYEWYLAGSAEKIKIPKHHVLTEDENIEMGNTQYLSEVIKRIGC